MRWCFDYSLAGCRACFITDSMFKVTIPSARTKGGVVVSYNMFLIFATLCQCFATYLCILSSVQIIEVLQSCLRGKAHYRTIENIWETFQWFCSTPPPSLEFFCRKSLARQRSCTPEQKIQVAHQPFVSCTFLRVVDLIEVSHDFAYD